MAKTGRRSALTTNSQGIDTLDKENTDSVPDSQAPWGGGEGEPRLHPTTSLADADGPQGRPLLLGGAAPASLPRRRLRAFDLTFYPRVGPEIECSQNVDDAGPTNGEHCPGLRPPSCLRCLAALSTPRLLAQLLA